MHTVDYFAVGAAILATARIMAYGSCPIREVFRVYAGLVVGIGIGMFSRDDGDCEVYILVGFAMMVVEVVAFVLLVVCPRVGCCSYVSALRARFFGNDDPGGAGPRDEMKPNRPPPPPPPRRYA